MTPELVLFFLLYRVARIQVFVTNLIPDQGTQLFTSSRQTPSFFILLHHYQKSEFLVSIFTPSPTSIPIPLPGYYSRLNFNCTDQYLDIIITEQKN